jgi:hypothetical protein
MLTKLKAVLSAVSGVKNTLISISLVGRQELACDATPESDVHEKWTERLFHLTSLGRH